MESQIYHHNLDPRTSLITLDPPPPTSHLPTSHILSIISAHASTTALLLLPGIQFYSGQLLDIRTITAAAHAAGIFVIWDLAHAVGNAELQLHEWGVDAAAWCSYKYLNAGPGSVGGLFVHENYGVVAGPASTLATATTASQIAFKRGFTNRFAGWWGNSKADRFSMSTLSFRPAPGAAGFQLSNPSILDITSLNASLEIFARAGGMAPLRAKSIRLTKYLEDLLVAMPEYALGHDDAEGLFGIITPRETEERGAQLSLRLRSGLLEAVMRELEERGVVVDERRPDVIRVAPAPLYNSFLDCWRFVGAFGEALQVARGEVVV